MIDYNILTYFVLVGHGLGFLSAQTLLFLVVARRPV